MFISAAAYAFQSGIVIDGNHICKSIICKKAAHCWTLITPMFDAQPAVVVKMAAGAADNPPDGIEPVRSATEGEPRLVTDVGAQEMRIVFADIRRVADDEGKGPIE